MILIIKHIDIEGPGTLGDFLKERKESFRTIELGAGEVLPSDLKGIDAVVALGGPMNVDEEDKYPFLKTENAFIQDVLRREVPYLGFCLGSQLLSKAAGARVTRSPVEEIGWYTVELTPEGKKDPFFRGYQEDGKIFHWHGDMFGVPAGGVLLASGTGCPHQALRVGKNAYGIQFHVEITDASIREWCEEYCRDNAAAGAEKSRQLLEGYQRHRASFDRQARTLYENFLDIVRKPARV